MSHRTEKEWGVARLVTDSYRKPQKYYEQHIENTKR